MSTVTLTCGVPASGKSTWAQAQAALTGAVIACRDDIRIMQGLKHGEDENKVTRVLNAVIEGAIMDGLDVIVADTNINKDFRNRLIKFVHKHGADVVIKTFPIALEEAVRRDSLRTASVGREVISKMHQSLTAQGVVDQVIPVQSFEAYKHKANKSGDAICIDIDGTVARHVSRSPYDYSKVSEDQPIDDVIDIVSSLSCSEYYDKIIFVSGRPDSCRDDTVSWLSHHILNSFELFMRKAGDTRPDWIIKNEIYDTEIIPHYNVRAVFDDRDQVVTHLRRRGLTVFQVAPGRF